MATSPEANNREPYEGGGGLGKFRKRPARKHNSTPYDRPSTVRNPSSSDGRGINNGWLSKLVDPAQRLITSSAHRLFGSVFRKRLPPAPVQQPPHTQSKPNQDARNKDNQVTFNDPPDAQDGKTSRFNYTSNTFEKEGVSDLEKILQQRSFTRSEIDRLTSLLQSRTVGQDEKRGEVGPSNFGRPCERMDDSPITPAREYRTERNLVATPAVISSVLEQDRTSPAEVAIAYMNGRPSSKVSQPLLSWRSELPREDSNSPVIPTFPSEVPKMSRVSMSPILASQPYRREAGRTGAPENGFATPRSLGRSAIYSMARTPYSRGHSTQPFKDVGFGGASSSSSRPAWDQSSASGSKQVSLKRRSSVLDSDIGSTGPIRRIRQKSNLLPSKTFSLRAFGSPLALRETDVISQASQQSSPLIQKLPSVDGNNQRFKKKLPENEDNRISASSSVSVPSKSKEMVSKILQHLEVLAPARDKSPTKLSVSMLQGPALRSMDTVDSLKGFQDPQAEKVVGVVRDTSLPGTREYISQKQNKVEENGPSKFTAPVKFAPAANLSDTQGFAKANSSNVQTTASELPTPVYHTQPQKKLAFRMSAHEDYLELDDDIHTNGFAVSPLAHGKEKLAISVGESEPIRSEAISVKESTSVSGGIPSTGFVPNVNSDKGMFKQPPVAEKQAFPDAPLTSMTAQPSSVYTKVDPIHSSGEKFSSFNRFNSPPSPSLKDPASTPVVSASAGVTFKPSSDAIPQNSSSSIFEASDAADSEPISYLSDKPDAGKGSTNTVVTLRVPETSPSSEDFGNVYSSHPPFKSADLNNASIASTSSLQASYTAASVSNDDPSRSSSLASVSNDDPVTAPPSTSAPNFKFASPTLGETLFSQVPSTSGVESADDKTKDTNAFTSASSFSIGTSKPMTITGNNIFGGFSASTGTLTSSSDAVTSTGNMSLSAPGVITSTAGNTFGSSSQQTLSTVNGIFGNSSAGSSTFGVSSLATSNNLFGATSPIISSTANNNILGGGTTASASAENKFLGFGTASSSAAAAINETGGSAVFNFGGTTTAIATPTQSMPSQISSSASSHLSQSAGNTTSPSGNSLFVSSNSVANPFSSVASFGLAPVTSVPETNSISTSSSTTPSIFGSSWQAPKASASPTFVTFNNNTAVSPSTGFAFGASSANSPNNMFGSSAGTPSTSGFSFTSAATAPTSQNLFGNSNPFAPPAAVNNDQMSMEDSMAEDTVHTSATTPIAMFGQQAPSGFSFASAAPAGANPFQFGGQQNAVQPQISSPFQSSSSFNAGGSFSLGTGGDKSNRKIFKARRKPAKK